MALSFASGTFSWNTTDAVSTVYTVSGLSFQPKAWRLWTVGPAVANQNSQTIARERLGVGFGTSTSDRRAVGIVQLDNAAAGDSATIVRADAIVAVPTEAGAVDGLLDLNSVTSDGGTFIIDDAISVSNLLVYW